MRNFGIKDCIIRFMAAAFVIVFLCGDLTAQDSIRPRNTFFSIGFLQIKESENYGLVFRGPSLDAGMNWTFPHKDNAWFYEFKLMVGAPIAKDIIGLNYSFKPIEAAYVWKIPVKKFGLKIGPALKMEYNQQMYPDLQSGYYFWLTQYSAGVSAFATVNLKNSLIKVRVFNNLCGFVSRGETWEDPYFFTDQFSDVVSDMHSEFSFVSLGTFNNTFFEIQYRRNAASRLAYSYVFDYFVYSDDPAIKFLNQSLRLTFIPRLKNEN